MRRFCAFCAQRLSGKGKLVFVASGQQKLHPETLRSLVSYELGHRYRRGAGGLMYGRILDGRGPDDNEAVLGLLALRKTLNTLTGTDCMQTLLPLGTNSEQ